MADRAIRSRPEPASGSYAGSADRPLGSFVLFMALYVAAVAGGGLAIWRSGRRLPERLSWSDVLLVSVATHKMARLVAKDPVTSPVRAPFTQFAGTSGPAELKEEVRGRGLRKAIGELVTCPFCLGQWIATGLVFGLVMAPRPTRLIAGIFTARAGADFLQFAYAKLEQ